MTYQRERDDFIAKATHEGLSTDTARRLLRYATTLDRLACAQCNGDWPADNGERKVKACVRCEGLWAPSVISTKGLCPDCRTEDLVKRTLPEGFEPIFHGDPRGAVLKLKVPSGKTDDWGQEGICVPARSH